VELANDAEAYLQRMQESLARNIFQAKRTANLQHGIEPPLGPTLEQEQGYFDLRTKFPLQIGRCILGFETVVSPTKRAPQSRSAENGLCEPLVISGPSPGFL
jgi:hypothetical protein